MILKSILVKSDSGEPHSVDLVFDNKTGISVHCSCQAGDSGQCCKHKTAVISGDASLLFDSSQNSSWSEVKKIFKESNLYEAYNNYLKQLHEIETEENKVKTKKKNLKAQFAQRLRDGIK